MAIGKFFLIMVKLLQCVHQVDVFSTTVMGGLNGIMLMIQGHLWQHLIVAGITAMVWSTI